MANLDFDNDPRRAIPFRLERHLNTERYSEFVRWLAHELYDPAVVQNLRAGSRDQLFRTISCIVANLVHAAFSIDQRCYLSISLREDTFAQSRYNSTRLGRPRFREVIELLHIAARPLIDFRIGGQDRARNRRWSTKLKAEDRLLQLFAGYTVRLRNEELGAADELNAVMRHIEAVPMVQNFRISRTDIADDVTETIILRDAEKKNTPYEDTDQISEMRRRLDSWNSFTDENFHVDIIISDQQLRNMFAPQPIQDAEAERQEVENDEADEEREQEFFNQNQRKTQFLDLKRTRLHRVFNNGSFQEGGRFYGAWWISVPKKYRSYITINNIPTTEYDFSTLHPTMLYAEAGVPLPAQPYAIDGVDPRFRKLIKKTFNALINAQPNQRIQQMAELPEGWNWGQFQEAIIARHQPIANQFRSGAGRRLQKVDSDVAERVMLSMQDRDSIVLPIHDSFITFVGHRDILEAAMLNAYREITGGEIRADRQALLEEVFNEEIGEGEEPLADFDIMNILEQQPGYDGYRARWRDFEDTRDEAWHRRFGDRWIERPERP
jgi:hypothetical protein